MVFDIDDQTFNDLDISYKRKESETVFAIFNSLNTSVGRSKLRFMIETPTSDIDLINDRKRTIEFLKTHNLNLKYSYRQFDFIEHYFNLTKIPLRNNVIDSFIDKTKSKIKPNNDYYLINTGVSQILGLSNELDLFLKSLPDYDLPRFIEELKVQIIKFLDHIKNKKIFNKKHKIKHRYLNWLDYLFRKKEKEFYKAFFDNLYTLECFLAVCKSMEKYGLTFAIYQEGNYPVLVLKSVFHPFLENPIANDFSLDKNCNLCFLTGPNMAGKSTLLKAIGLSVYLAHLGFPVPAKYMKISVLNGLISTINLPDNINLGYSHYFSEVSRLKEISKKLLKKGNYLIVFDELFRGTNVKDASEGTFEVVKALSKVKDCLFLISSHFYEITDQLTGDLGISFKYLDSTIVNNTPKYDYKLKDGITEERLGMQIIRNEKVLEILDQVIQRQGTKLQSH